MYLSDVLDFVVNSEISGLGIVENYLKKDNSLDYINARESLVNHINLGLNQLSTRFFTNTEVEIIDTYPEINVYTLKQERLVRVMDVYDSTGKSLQFPFTVGSTEFDIKELAFDIFLIPKPIEEKLMFVCKVNHPTVTLDTDLILIPEAMIEALVNYVVSKVYGSVGGVSNQQNNTFYQKFELSCNKLVEYGYSNHIDSLSKDITKRGFV